ncbi:MAG: tetratricopeptide repeat protein [Pyrinomonadaceae bacterium]|nr:tetratricopeptide repeat protein [Pyrinomonadaceae bacterium]
MNARNESLSMTGIQPGVLAFLFLISSALAAYAQGAHTLQGRVVTPAGHQPNSPVKITLTLNGRRIYETFTDLSGRFSFTGLNRGRYQITAEGDGQSFDTTSVYAEVSAFGSAPQLFTQDVQLRAIPGKPMQQAGVVSAFSQDVPKRAREALERSIELTGEGKTQAAIEKIQEALKEFPEYFEAHFQLGNQYLKAGRFDEAVSQLDRARQINPNDERVYQSFGLVLMQQKNYAVAVAVFSEAARLNPVNPFNALMRGTALIHQAYAIAPSSSDTAVSDKQYIISRAEISLTLASNLSDKKVKADHLTLAMLYEMKGDYARAAKELEGHLQDNPNAKNADSLRTIIKRLRSSSDSKTPQP